MGPKALTEKNPLCDITLWLFYSLKLYPCILLKDRRINKIAPILQPLRLVGFIFFIASDSLVH